MRMHSNKTFLQRNVADVISIWRRNCVFGLYCCYWNPLQELTFVLVQYTKIKIMLNNYNLTISHWLHYVRNALSFKYWQNSAFQV